MMMNAKSLGSHLAEGLAEWMSRMVELDDIVMFFSFLKGQGIPLPVF